MPIVYNIGLRKPNGGFPAARFASLRSEMMPAKAGVEADVPPMSAPCPW